MDLLPINNTNIVRCCLVRHINFMDVAIRIYNTPPLPCKRLLIEGFYVNLAFTNSFNIGQTPLGTTGSHIMLTLEKIPEWQIYAGEDILREPMFGTMSKSYRNAEWEPLVANFILAKSVDLKI